MSHYFKYFEMLFWLVQVIEGVAIKIDCDDCMSTWEGCENNKKVPNRKSAGKKHTLL